MGSSGPVCLDDPTGLQWAHKGYSRQRQPFGKQVLNITRRTGLYTDAHKCYSTASLGHITLPNHVRVCLACAPKAKALAPNSAEAAHSWPSAWPTHTLGQHSMKNIGRVCPRLAAETLKIDRTPKQVVRSCLLFPPLPPPPVIDARLPALVCPRAVADRAVAGPSSRRGECRRSHRRGFARPRRGGTEARGLPSIALCGQVGQICPESTKLGPLWAMSVRFESLTDRIGRPMCICTTPTCCRE